MENILLMCKDNPVYSISNNEILNIGLLPGAMLESTMSYDEWIKTRYSADSNVTARRLMMRALGTDNHKIAEKITRALSLSDCYWIKEKNENILFKDISPYYNKEWDGNGEFKGGSISTVFVNGAANKKWENNKYLIKYGSVKEYYVYELMYKLKIENAAKGAIVKNNDLYLENFTNDKIFLESLGQSGFAGEYDNHLEVCVKLFGLDAVKLMAIDYMTEHDDRHSGNIGFLRDADNGDYIGMAPYYDFDWAWSGNVYPIPDIAMILYGKEITKLCRNTINAAWELFGNDYRYKTVEKRGKELISDC